MYYSSPRCSRIAWIANRSHSADDSRNRSLSPASGPFQPVTHPPFGKRRAQRRARVKVDEHGLPGGVVEHDVGRADVVVREPQRLVQVRRRRLDLVHAGPPLLRPKRGVVATVGQGRAVPLEGQAHDPAPVHDAAEVAAQVGVRAARDALVDPRLVEQPPSSRKSPSLGALR